MLSVDSSNNYGATFDFEFGLKELSSNEQLLELDGTGILNLNELHFNTRSLLNLQLEEHCISFINFEQFQERTSFSSNVQFCFEDIYKNTVIDTLMNHCKDSITLYLFLELNKVEKNREISPTLMVLCNTHHIDGSSFGERAFASDELASILMKKRNKAIFILFEQAEKTVALYHEGLDLKFKEYDNKGKEMNQRRARFFSTIEKFSKSLEYTVFFED